MKWIFLIVSLFWTGSESLLFGTDSIFNPAEDKINKQIKQSLLNKRIQIGLPELETTSDLETTSFTGKLARRSTIKCLSIDYIT